ncbi:hypothetical protein ACTWQF_28265 [Streptomyces sp. 8N114]|uniref:hypothetical protein n=1 Tax=Streptomyces sp. 8N114 TaxID=3457419 RepID=UPI003FD23488
MLDVLAQLGSPSRCSPRPFLAVVRADEPSCHPGPDDLIPLTCNEIRRLFIALVVRLVHDAAHHLDTTHW